MRAADVPMEVLGLHVERKRVRDQRIQRSRYFAHAVGSKVSRGIDPSGSSTGFKLSHLGGHGVTSCLEGHEKEGHEKKRGMGDLVSAQA